MKIRGKNSSAKIFIVLIILAILLIGIGVVFVGFSSIKKDNKKEELTLTEADKIKYGEEIDLAVKYFNNYLAEEFPLSNVDELTDDEKTLFLIKSKVNINSPQVNVSELENIKNQYFNEFELFLDNIVRDEQVLYGYQNDKFVLMNDANLCVANSKMVSSKEGIQSWKVKHKVYYLRDIVMPDNSVVKAVYNNYNNCSEQINQILTLPLGAVDLTEQQYEEYNSHFNTYVYTLNRINEHYIMKSVTVEE